MEKAIKIDDYVALDQTSVEILKIISTLLGKEKEGRVSYNLIADILEIDRDTVRKSVNRMVDKNVLRKQDKKLSIQNAVVVE
ncbi:MAG: winged helix-turn-helix transcriptional regulator [Clostridia bacterium]|nr:winged helix-turn-helix transcriptional regulator [Clostridia bacterium]